MCAEAQEASKTLAEAWTHHVLSREKVLLRPAETHLRYRERRSDREINGCNCSVGESCKTEEEPITGAPAPLGGIWGKICCLQSNSPSGGVTEPRDPTETPVQDVRPASPRMGEPGLPAGQHPRYR